MFEHLATPKTTDHRRFPDPGDPARAVRLATALDQWRVAFARGDHREVERLVRQCRAERDTATASISTDWIRS